MTLVWKKVCVGMCVSIVPLLSFTLPTFMGRQIFKKKLQQSRILLLIQADIGVLRIIKMILLLPHITLRKINVHARHVEINPHQIKFIRLSGFYEVLKNLIHKNIENYSNSTSHEYKMKHSDISNKWNFLSSSNWFYIYQKFIHWTYFICADAKKICCN